MSSDVRGERIKLLPDANAEHVKALWVILFDEGAVTFPAITLLLTLTIILKRPP